MAKKDSIGTADFDTYAAIELALAAGEEYEAIDRIRDEIELGLMRACQHDAARRFLKVRSELLQDSLNEADRAMERAAKRAGVAYLHAGLARGRVGG